LDQLTQKLKSGEMAVHEVPSPQVGPGMVLVQNHYSLISAGTEGSTVKTARASLYAKAKERPQQVKQVLDTLRSQGITQTYRAVMKKLDAYSSLGYSCVGRVIGVGSGVTEFRLGDHAACGGLTACHAEVVAVPVNLCVKVPDDADLKQAAYNTLGAIALQGVRQAEMRLGETCAVIGLGLLGQLTCLLLRASGVRVVAVDINETMVQMAGAHCADLALRRTASGIEGQIAQFSGGVGCDAVIITAATDSLDPINFAGAVARKRGTVVVLGAVPTGFDRDPHYYRKELQLRMSCSYGPGRYDPEYEEKGRDYPAGYVRWTEKRNMQAFQELVHARRIDVSYLTTHVFKLQDAPSAYDMILEKSEPSVGILIEYDTAKHPPQSSAKVVLGGGVVRAGRDKICLGVIGAGSYAQSHLLPNLRANSRVVLKGVMTATACSARSAGERYGFEFCTGNPEDILENPDIDTVVIATRHDTHADYVKRALHAGKNVFVEKPLCLTAVELAEIQNVHAATQKAGSAPLLMVGYNRRFSPFIRSIKDVVGNGPIAVTYRVNSGAIPPDSWVQDVETGGGRILGEVCHFVDTLICLTGSLPVSVYAAALPDAHHLHDSLQACLRFADGSVGHIAYLANGDKSLPKERVEVYGHGTTAVLDDYRALTLHSRGKAKKRQLLSQDKGQQSEVAHFLERIQSGGGAPIPLDELWATSDATLKIVESIYRGESVTLNGAPGA
jgi:polar amino acid transport system substrate-binding protein